MNTELALEVGIWTRQRADRDRSRLVHHSNRGEQYRAVSHTDRLAEAESVASAGSKGDSYDNAMAGLEAQTVLNSGFWR